MRIASRKFLNQVGSRDEIVNFGNNYSHLASWQFNSAIGELRRVFDIYIAKVAGMYGLDLENELAQIFLKLKNPTTTPVFFEYEILS